MLSKINYYTIYTILPHATVHLEEIYMLVGKLLVTVSNGTKCNSTVNQQCACYMMQRIKEVIGCTYVNKH